MFVFSGINDAPGSVDLCQGPPVEIELDFFLGFAPSTSVVLSHFALLLAHKIIAYFAKFLMGWDVPYVNLPRGISGTEETTSFPVGPDRHSVGG